MLPNIVLIGFMGCGKSSVGRRLSALTGHRFVDTDDLIVQKEKRVISGIFSSVGEEGFRDIEERVLSDFVGVAGIVLATGGGAILREANRIAMKKIGTVAWLDAQPDALFERASRSQRRPLLQTENPRQTFDSLLEFRRPLYAAAADFRLDSTGLEHDEVAQKILALTMQRESR